MSSYRIALNFEDGVTRIIQCGAKEKVLDAAFRQRINLPMDCSDGVCGTCKCRAESGQYDLGDDYIDDALSSDEAEQGLVLTCQMIPQSDCVVRHLAGEVLAKVDAQLQAQGIGRERIVSANVWLSSPDHFAAFNTVWDAWVPAGHAPTRACVQALLMAPGLDVEVAVIAAL